MTNKGICYIYAGYQARLPTLAEAIPIFKRFRASVWKEQAYGSNNPCPPHFIPANTWDGWRALCASAEEFGHTILPYFSPGYAEMSGWSPLWWLYEEVCPILAELGANGAYCDGFAYQYDPGGKSCSWSSDDNLAAASILRGMLPNGLLIGHFTHAHKGHKTFEPYDRELESIFDGSIIGERCPAQNSDEGQHYLEEHVKARLNDGRTVYFLNQDWSASLLVGLGVQPVGHVLYDATADKFDDGAQTPWYKRFIEAEHLTQ